MTWDIERDETGEPKRLILNAQPPKPPVAYPERPKCPAYGFERPWHTLGCPMRRQPQ